MAHYEFHCGKCGKTFSVRHSFAEHDRHKAVKCPACGGTQTRQLISPVHVQTAKKS